MKQIWRRRMANGFLNLFILLLCQPVPKAFGQLLPDEKASQCELSLENKILEDVYATDPAYRRNYLIKHLPDTDKWLTEEKERELVYIYQNEKNQIIKERVLIAILSSHINLIRKMAYSISRSWGREDFAEDLIQDAVIRLIKHLNIHDPERGRIVSHILSYMSKFMNKKMARYISPVLVSNKYKKEIEETEDIMLPIATALTTYKPENDNDNIDDNNIEDISLKPVESWTEANEHMNQIKDFILRIGGTPRQRYILRHRIFTFEPEPSHSIAEKFETHPSGVVIGVEEKKLVEKISKHLSNGSPMEQDQIFTEISRIIEAGNPFPLVSDNEMNWQTEDLAKQIKYLIQEMDTSPKQRHILKDQQAESIAKEVGLDEINQYILRYRLMEEPNRRQISSDIGKKFGISTQAIHSREKKILKKLHETEFTSPELQEITERINLEARKKKTQSSVMNEKKKDQLAESLAKQMGLNEVKQYILRYRLMEEPNNRQTRKAIGEMFNIKLQTIADWQTRILQKMQNTTFRSAKLKRIAEKILLEKEQKKKSSSTAVNKNELDQETENMAKQLEDFILEAGDTPRQIYVLRYRIFTFYPESFQSIAKKFKCHQNDILLEEHQLLQKISQFLISELSMNKDQIFREMINRIRNGESFLFVNNNETNWQSKNLIRQAGLNEIEEYILKHRFLAGSNKRKTESAIGEIFGINRLAISRQEKSMLQKLKELESISPELKEIVEKILSTAKQKQRPIPIIDKERLSQEWSALPQEWKQNEVSQHIFEHRLLRDPKDRKTLVEIAKMLDISKFIMQRREQAILKILKERGLVSFEQRSSN